jgi:putative DNA primase/helicase
VANATDTMPEAQLRAEREAQLRPDTDYHPSYEDLNDDSNAEVFAKEFGDHLRYDHARKRWLVWDGHWWKVDSDTAVMRKAMRLLKRRFADSWEIGQKKYTNFLQRSRNEKPLKACLALAASKVPIATDGKQWDSDPFLLGVENGVIDLRTGQLRDGLQSDAITRHSPVEFNPDATCPRWQQFLAEVFENDAELIEYIQQMIGYSLTRDTSEQCFFFGQGTGANGKSTFLETVHKLLGDDLARTLPFDELTEKKFGHSHPAGLAHIEGARCIIATEGAKQTVFDTQRIKLITGEDKVSARGMRENFRDFYVTGKVWIAANHAPIVNDRTHSFWRRLRVIPFDVTFEGTAIDPQLSKTLAAELPGILAWAVRGCLKWQENKRGQIPPRVIEANALYEDAANPYKEFFEDRCEFGDKTAFTVSEEIADAYAEYRKTHAELPALNNEFYGALQEKGAKPCRPYVKGNRVRAWRGVKLIPSLQEEYKIFCDRHGADLSFGDWLGYMSYTAD